ncbi:unnamed protein product [Fusarium equiseti]|uniref:Uncharacterized protein n=1 Tax=Fusarium equiseti TaxID=61235 RepID=A0A8J2IYY7_FUSEQ|nr:unnamed protein product [Fusarium equiseti]
MAPRVDHKRYSLGRAAHSAQRVYEYTGQWPHELVQGFGPASWAETSIGEFATLIGIASDAKNVEIKDVLARLKTNAAKGKDPDNRLTRSVILEAREWLRVEKGIDAKRRKKKRSRQEDSDDESEEEVESESDPEPLPEIYVYNSEDSTSDSSRDDDETEADEQSHPATKTRPTNRQLTGVQNNQHLPTPSLSPEAARKRLFDGLDEHYRRAVRRAAMAGKRQSQPQPKPQLLLTPPTSGDSIPPNKKCDEAASSSSPLSEIPASPDEPWPERLRTRAGNVSLPNRPGQLESPFRRESAASMVTIPDSTADSRDTAPASPASVSSSCDEHEQTRAPTATPATAPATAAPPSSTVAPATNHAHTPANDRPNSTSTDPTSATGRPRRNIQLPSRSTHSEPQSAVANVEKSCKRPLDPAFATREHPMSLASSPDTEENSAFPMGSLARNSPVPAISTQAVSAPSSSSQRVQNTTPCMSIASLLHPPIANVGSTSSSPKTLGRDGESTIPPQSKSPPTSVSPRAKRQKIGDTGATRTSSDVDTPPKTQDSPEDLPDYDSLISDWDTKAARVVNAHTNIQENRKALSEQSNHIEFLEHMHKAHPPDEDGRKHYEYEKRKLGDIQFLHGIFLRGFEEAKSAAVANADPDVTLVEQARRMGAHKRKRQA